MHWKLFCWPFSHFCFDSFALTRHSSHEKQNDEKTLQKKRVLLGAVDGMGRLKVENIIVG